MNKINISTKKYPDTYTLVDDEDYDVLNNFKWYPHKDHAGATYVNRQERRADGKQYIIIMHRVIMNCPKGIFVDHINHDTLDNRKENLRICSVAQNQYNKKKTRGTSKYKGVSRAGKKWKSQVAKDYKIHYIGTFETEEKAAEAYNKKALNLFGVFAHINMIKGVENNG